MRSAPVRLVAVVALVITGFAAVFGAAAPSVPRSELLVQFANRAQHRQFDKITRGHQFADAEIGELADVAKALGAHMGTDLVLATQDAKRRYEYLYNATRFGYRGNGKTVSDAAIASGTAILTSATAAFVAGDVGSTIYVNGAGAAGVLLATTILSRQSATQVTLAVNASTTIASGGVISWGTDDYNAIQGAITAAIATGGRVHCPAGTPLLGTGLDFSAMKSATGAKPVIFDGSGSGSGQAASAYIPAFGGTTVFLNATGGECIKANGTATSQPIVGLRLEKFAIKNTATAAAGKFTISLDLVSEQCVLNDLYVTANGQGGNGVAFMNMPLGQSSWDRVIAQGFTSTSDGIAFKISNEVTANVGTAPNSGNSSFRSCVARDARIGYYLLGTTLLNGLTFESCKAVNTGSSHITGSIGFYLNGAVHQNVFMGCHSEDFSTGFAVAGGKFNTFISPLAAFSGTPDANSAGVRIYSTAVGNTVIGARVTSLHYGVSFEGTAKSNYASGSDAAGGRVLTSFFRDNTTNVPTTNVTYKIEDGSTTPVVNYQGHSLQQDGFEVLTATELLTSGEATIPRLVAFSSAATTLGTQIVRFTFFTAKKTESITQVRVPSGGTAAGATPSLCRVGIWYVDTVASRSVSDGVSNTTTTITSATAAFTAADVNRTITGTDIPAGTYIASVTNATTAVLSQAATGTHTADAWTIGGLGNGSLIASIGSDTTLWATQNTDYLRSLSGTFSKVKGQRYAMGHLCVTAAAAPSMNGYQLMGAGTPGSNAAARAPRLSGALTAQADLPTTFTDAGLTATGVMIYGELVP